MWLDALQHKPRRAIDRIMRYSTCNVLQRCLIKVGVNKQRITYILYSGFRGQTDYFGINNKYYSYVSVLKFGKGNNNNNNNNLIKYYEGSATAYSAWQALKKDFYFLSNIRL